MTQGVLYIMTDRPSATKWPYGPFLSHDQLTDERPSEPRAPKQLPENPPKPVDPPKPVSSVLPSPRRAPDDATPDDAAPGGTPEPAAAKEDATGDRDEDGSDADDEEDEDDAPRGLRKLKWFKVNKTDGDETDSGQGSGDEADAAPAADPVAKEAAPQGESWYAAVARRAGEAARDKTLARRRILAAKWAVGAGIGYAFNLDHYVTDLLATTENDPGKVVFCGFFIGGGYVIWKALGRAQRWLQPTLGSVGDIIASFGNVLARVPLVGPLVGLVTNLFHAVFTNYVPFRVLVTGAGAWLAAPWGFVTVGYAQAHGIDMTQIGPHAVGLATAAVSWWQIERRTENWCGHWPGMVGHVVSHLPTGTLLLATALYRVS